MLAAEIAYLFRHAMLRDAAYQLHTPSERARLHALVFDVITTLFPGDDADTFARELADHAHTAREVDAARWLEREAVWLNRAAELARDAWHMDDAVRFNRRLADLPGRSAEQRASALWAAARASFYVGSLRDALDLARLSADTAPAGDVRGEALNVLATATRIVEGAGAAEPIARESVEVFRRSGNRKLEALRWQTSPSSTRAWAAPKTQPRPMRPPSVYTASATTCRQRGPHSGTTAS